MTAPDRRPTVRARPSSGPAPAGGLDELAARSAARQPASRLASIQESAKGWHTAQVAILGLLGIIGVARDAQTYRSLPAPALVIALVATLAAFALATTGAFLIARVAWPLYRQRTQTTPAADELTAQEAVARAQRRLRRSILCTVAATGAMGLAFAVSWWPPSSTGSGLVRLVSPARTLCGQLESATSTAVLLRIGGQQVVVPMTSGTTIQPVSSCP